MDHSGLKEEYGKCIKFCSEVRNSNELRNSKNYSLLLEKALHSLQNCINKIEALGLFSSNEEIDDIQTNDIKYLSILYLLATMYERMPSSSTADRKIVVERTRKFYIQFLQQCKNYNVIPEHFKPLINKYINLSIDDLVENYLNPLDKGVSKREEKITRYKLEKELEANIKHLDLSSSYFSQSLDEETIRKLYIDQIQLYVTKSFDSLDSINLEIQLLKNAPKNNNLSNKEDENLKKIDNSTKLNTSLYSSKNTNPILSKEGKILRPFVLTGNTLSQRDALSKEITASADPTKSSASYKLPTMTMDEFLSAEKQRGGILPSDSDLQSQQKLINKYAFDTQRLGYKPPEESNDVVQESLGSGVRTVIPKEESDNENEDDEKVTDAATYKAREWDEYVENNPKGSGNTMNLG